jgi:hypothetical protein
MTRKYFPDINNLDHTEGQNTAMSVVTDANEGIESLYRFLEMTTEILEIMHILKQEDLMRGNKLTDIESMRAYANDCLPKLGIFHDALCRFEFHCIDLAIKCNAASQEAIALGNEMVAYVEQAEKVAQSMGNIHTSN